MINYRNLHPEAVLDRLINIHEEKVVNVCTISNILFKLPFEEFYIICYIYEIFGSNSMLIHVMIFYVNAP